MQATHAIAEKQNRAMNYGQAKQYSENYGDVTLAVTDEGPDAEYVIHIYNILSLRHEVNQPPNFPRFVVPPCAPGQRFSHTTIPAFIRNRYQKTGTNEYYYQREDGRKSATSLLNPSVHPTSPWETQIQDITPGDPRVASDQFGNNLNAYGVFWSLTEPDSPELDEEIALVRQRVERTMKALVEQAETFYSANDRKSISPRMHFAMDYLGLSAPWHQSTARMTPCPNCGMHVREGLAYHKNEFGEKCIIDRKKYDELFPPEHEKKGKKEKETA
jgi:hypothetical protein